MNVKSALCTHSTSQGVSGKETRPGSASDPNEKASERSLISKEINNVPTRVLDEIEGIGQSEEPHNKGHEEDKQLPQYKKNASGKENNETIIIKPTRKKVQMVLVDMLLLPVKIRTPQDKRRVSHQ
ncbi:hypothetical protein CHS0354_038327 [Potamilus streckersoni]|uniref:Uncharacterized protein n=1 Tax=Potamilus streckersoni TaxID=2493646 RepID=A0AAE0RQT1_9BIVA|nr:hypothetical protein CHS0354_038327 [Potamilus streckersoni]